MALSETIRGIINIFAQVPFERMLVRKPYVVEPQVLSREISGTGATIPAELIETVQISPADEGRQQSEYAGTSQISSAGKACIPCGNDHFSTASNLLSEARRFALENKTLDHPEIILRIAHAEDELNGFEREDGSPSKIVELPTNEKAMMDEMLKASRNLRHELKELTAESSMEDLERVGSLADQVRKDFRTRLFRLQLDRLSPEQQRQIKDKADAIMEKRLNEV